MTQTKWMLGLLAAFLLVVPWAFGQSQFATLSGSVRDSSGAVISDAAVIVKDAASGETRKSVTNEAGFFSVTALLAGTYNITVERSGFEKWHGTGVVLHGSDTRAMNIELKVGADTETVEVQAIGTELAPVDSGEKSALITTKDLQDLALVSRNAAEFIKILPGAALAVGDGTNREAYNGEVVGINGFSIGGNAGALSAVNVNGQLVNITQDGQNVNDPGAQGAATPVNPNPNMISEVKVLSSNFGSENAQGPVVVNSVTKSGTSAFHGEAYLNARNTALNSEDAFQKWNETNSQGAFAPGSLKNKSDYYYPGGNIGGPVIIPGTGFNKSRRKLFFFEGFEYYKQQLDGGLERAFVPTTDMLNGDFSALTAGYGAGEASSHPTIVAVPTAPAAGAWGGFDIRSGAGCTITGGVLSPACIDPSAQKLMKNYLPTPNIDPGPTGLFNYVQATTAAQNSYQNVVRGDWNISDNTKVYVTWSRQRERAVMPFGLWNGSADFAVPSPSPVVGNNASDFLTTTFTHVFSPTMTSETLFGYSKINFPTDPSDPAKLTRGASTFPLTGYYNNPETPAIVSWGNSVPNLGDIGHDYHPTMVAVKATPSVQENLTKVIKSHTTKFGFYFEHLYNTQDNWGQYMGALSYNQWGTASGNNYADMLMGIGQAGYFEQALPPPSELAQNIYAFYAQDDWKLTRRISVQYGMRFEHYAKPYSPGDGLAVFNPTQYVAGTENAGISWHGIDSHTPLSGASSRNFFYSPRVGAAIDLFGTGRTVLRGGWGKYRAYDSVQSNAYTGPAQTALGSVSFSCGQNDPNCYTWEDIDNHSAANCTVAPCAPKVVFGQAPNFANTGFSVVNPFNDEQPLVTSYSLSIDQQMPARFKLELSYVGNHSDFLQGTVNTNSVPIGTLNAPGFSCPAGTGNNTSGSCQQAFRPYSQYQGITSSVTAGKAQYDALQASLLRNVGILTLQANYTWAKAEGDGSALNNGGLMGALPGYGQHFLWGVLPIDRGQVLSLAYVLNMPKMNAGSRVVRGFANGWQISGITQVESGVQLTAQSGANLTFNLGMAPNLTNVLSLGTPDATLYPQITCNPTQGVSHNQYLNPKCFTAPAPGTLGTGSMPYMPGPMFWNTDLSLTKNMRITERQQLQFRFSAFNMLNHDLLSFGTGDSNLKLNINDLGQAITGAVDPVTKVACPIVTGGIPCAGVSTFGIAGTHFGHRNVELGVKYSF
jgi:hypothetical protein